MTAAQVHNSFAEAIKEQTKGVLHKHVLLSIGQGVTPEQERQLENGKYKDVCAQAAARPTARAPRAPAGAGGSGRRPGGPRRVAPWHHPPRVAPAGAARRRASLADAHARIVLPDSVWSVSGG